MGRKQPPMCSALTGRFGRRAAVSHNQSAQSDSRSATAKRQAGAVSRRASVLMARMRDERCDDSTTSCIASLPETLHDYHRHEG